MKRSGFEVALKNVPREEVSGRQRLRDILLTVGVLAVTVLFTELLRKAGPGDETLVMVYMLSVMVISRFTSGYICGIAAALFSSLAYDFLITQPRMTFSFSIGSPITLVAMLLATFLTSTLTIQLKNHSALHEEREHRSQILREISEKLLAVRDIPGIVSMAADYLAGHLGRQVVFYTCDPTAEGDSPRIFGGQDSPLFHNEAEFKRVHRIFQSGGEDPASIFDDESPAVSYVPVVSQGKLLGLVGISSEGNPLHQSELAFARTVSRQVALTLELQMLSDRQNRTQLDAEKEKMRSTLLRAISHDLRTPLTSILGSSNTILEQTDMDRQTVEKLVVDIRENTQWLIRMVENILTITKISKDTMKVSKTMEAAEEVISQSVSIVRRRFPDWQIHVRIPNELLMVPMDATLISQVIINILENAVKNSPAGSLILLSLKEQEGFARFDISDNGWGIPEEVLDNLFEAHSPAKERFIDSVRGIGIGLSICQAIVQAHGGKIEGTNRKEGGAKFTFTLPLAEEGQA